MPALKPVVVSYCNDESRAQNLVRSCYLFSWPLRLIVEDQSCWKGWGYRLKRVLQEIDWCRSQGYTHMIHVDAYDVVAMQPYDTFSNYPDLFISAEINCWPDPDFRKHHVYDPSGSSLIDTPWHYAHSQFCLELSSYEAMRDEFGFGVLRDADDDQLHMHRIYDASHPGRGRTVASRLDNQCELFQSIAFCHPWQTFFSAGRGDGVAFGVRNRLTGHWPTFFHGNGKTDMSWLIKLLGNV